jgi:hypothetical protein
MITPRKNEPLIFSVPFFILQFFFPCPLLYKIKLNIYPTRIIPKARTPTKVASN